MNEVHPAILAAMNHERQFMQSQLKGSRRVKLDRGKTWLIRFLPVKLGPSGTWFARIARHWVAMKPIICPRNTSPDFGGDPEAYCPCCDVAANINDTGSTEEIQKFGYSAMGTPTWLTFCIVWEKDGAVQTIAEVLQPYEYSHYKSTFEELMSFYQNGLRRSENSILDYKLGNDFAVTRTGKGYKLDKQDSAPIFDLSEPNYKVYIQKIEAAVKLPKIEIPTNEQLLTFSEKMHEMWDKMENGGSSASPRRGRHAPAEDMEESGNEEGFQEDDEAPARSPARRPAPAAAETETPRRAPAPVGRRAAPAAADESTESSPEDNSNPELMPQAAEDSEPAEAEVPVRSPARRLAPAAPARPAPAAPGALTQSLNRARAAEAAASAPEPEAEEEAMPEEAVDAAPPAEASMSENGAEEPPAPVKRTGAGLGANIKSRIDGITRKGA